MDVYKGYQIQISDSDVFIRDRAGKIIGKVETVEEAEEFIDEIEED